MHPIFLGQPATWDLAPAPDRAPLAYRRREG
jgi:hypothetical protein